MGGGSSSGCVLIFAGIVAVTVNAEMISYAEAEAPLHVNRSHKSSMMMLQKHHQYNYNNSTLDRYLMSTANNLTDDHATNLTGFFNDSSTSDRHEHELNETERELLLDQIRDYISPRSWTWILIGMHIVVFLVGIFGNVLVCVAVYRNHSMRTVTNYFIVNLAVADFLVILFCLPPSVVWDVTFTWFFGVAMCKIVLYLQSVSVTVSVLTLTFISIDRWYAICFPLKFKSTTSRAKTAIAIIWIVALLCDIPEAISATTVQTLPFDTIYLTQCEPTWTNETDTLFLSTKMILFYVIPLVFMSVAYVQIIRVLWRSSSATMQFSSRSNANTCTRNNTASNAEQEHHQTQQQIGTVQMNMNSTTAAQLRSRRKAAKMLGAVVVMFAVCYFPVHLISVLRKTVGLKNTEANTMLSLFSHWLCYANSAINPIIYNFMSGRYRVEFQRAFIQCWRTSPHTYNAIYRNYDWSLMSKRSGVEIPSSLKLRTSTNSTINTIRLNVH